MFLAAHIYLSRDWFAGLPENIVWGYMKAGMSNKLSPVWAKSLSPARPHNKKPIFKSWLHAAIKVNLNEWRVCNNTKSNTFIQIFSLLIHTYFKSDCYLCTNAAAPKGMDVEIIFVRIITETQLWCLRTVCLADTGRDTLYIGNSVHERWEMERKGLYSPRRKETSTGYPPGGQVWCQVREAALCQGSLVHQWAEHMGHPDGTCVLAIATGLHFCDPGHSIASTAGPSITLFRSMLFCFNIDEIPWELNWFCFVSFSLKSRKLQRM